MQAGPQAELHAAAPLAALPRLALDAVGGASAGRLVGALADGGTLVVYGCLDGHPPALPWQAWVHHGLQARPTRAPAPLRKHGPRASAAPGSGSTLVARPPRRPRTPPRRGGPRCTTGRSFVSTSDRSHV